MTPSVLARPARRPAFVTVGRRPRPRLRLEALDDRVVPAVFTVTSTADAGPGSLRQAIFDSNGTPGPDTIGFNIGAGGVQTIRPTAPLPTVTDPVVIDGTTQPGYAGAPIVELNGSQAGIGTTGLTITAGNSTVRGLVVNAFYYADGILLTTNGGNRIVGNYVGTDVTGSITSDFHIGQYGVEVLSGTGNMIGGTTAADRNVISAYPTRAISISAGGTVVQGNYIGTDATGTQRLVPGGTFIGTGVLVTSGGGNLIGGTAPGAGNLISGTAVAIATGSNGDGGNRIQGNRVGTDVTGTLALGNTTGISVAAANELVGGAEAGARNVVAAAGHTGIAIGGLTGRVEGNYVGTDVTGTRALGNVTGVGVEGSGNVFVGNLVSGNALYGVTFSPNTGVVRGNFIGTDVTGTAALPNRIGLWASGGVVGGLAPGDGNLISGNTEAGVEFSGQGLQGNRIGTDVTGTKALGNGTGILVTSTFNSVIGGTAAGAGNLISGNRGDGIAGRGENNLRVEGNRIGTDAAGTAALPNGGHGINLSRGESMTIGGSVAGARNVISGNALSGIALANASSFVRVAGNFIGTNAAGTAALGNGAHGIHVNSALGSPSNVIGGTTAGFRNVISGNALDGIRLEGTKAGLFQVQGNFIGTNSTGTLAVPNGGSGVVANGGAGVTIGGTAAGATNVVSGNAGDGVVLMSAANLVQGNRIGTNPAGTQPLGNGRYGVAVTGSNNVVGGTAAAARNLISGNASSGINLIGGTGTVVQGNRIGTDVGGTTALGNGLDGVTVNAAGNTIGGLAAGAANTIAFNGRAGVAVQGGGAVGDRVQANSVYANGGLGIDLGGDGPTPNDPGDTDTGPNGLLNFPVLADVRKGPSTRVLGTLDSPGNGPFQLDFFANPTSAPGEGRRYMGTITVAADGAFDVTVPGATVPGEWVSATATDKAGSTSEFGAPVAARSLPPVANAGGPYTVAEGGTVALHGSGTDPDDTALTYAWDLDGDGTFETPGPDATFSAAGRDGPTAQAVTLRVTDPYGVAGTATATVQITNAPPAAADHSVATDEDVPAVLNVLAGITDAGLPDTHTAVPAAFTTALGGRVTVAADGSATYTPAGGFTGTDTFEYVATDDDGGTDTGAVTVAVRNLVDLAGRVFDDRDNDGLFEPADGDAGLAGVAVQVWDADRTTLLALATTAADGAYLLDANLRPGGYAIVEAFDEAAAGLLDGREAAGGLGGTVDNARNSNVIGVTVAAGDPDAGGYDFAEIRPARLGGLVWEDFNADGRVNFGERAVAGAAVTLTGADDRGNPVAGGTATDAQGLYEFADLRPGVYTLAEAQPAGFVDGADALGTVDGLPSGDASVNDVFGQIALGRPGAAGENYNFGERPAPGAGAQPGQTAAIGFWQNDLGQALIRSLNGGPTATQLGDWLAATFPNVYGPGAGATDLTGQTNDQVAALFVTLAHRTGGTAPPGPPKLDAQVMAAALAVYVTNTTLAGSTAVAYGFQVTATGVGYSTVSVGASGAAFGVADGTALTVLDLLLAVDARAANGLLYDLDGSGTISPAERDLRTQAHDLFGALNEVGGL